MTKQTIEVEVPEGWRVKEYRMPNKGDYFWHQNRVCVASSSFIDQRLIIEKIQPRRVVLEETDEERSVSYGEWIEYEDGLIGQWPDEKYGSNISYKVWREVKGNDIPLTNDSANVKMGLSQGDGEVTMNLTKKDMIDLICHIKLGGQLNPKVSEFIKDES